YQYNLMQYFDEQKHDLFYQPSTIYFSVFIAPTAFRELVNNVRGGLFPEKILIDLPSKKAPIELGWEPDGSGMIWHNKEKENRRIAIEVVRFDYAVVKPRYDENKDEYRLLPMQAATDRINEQIVPIQTSLAEMLKYLRWITMGIVALAIMIAIS